MVVQHGDSIDNNVSLRMNRPLLMKLSTNRSVTSHLTNEPVSFQRFRISTVEYHANVRVYTFKTCRNFFQRRFVRGKPMTLFPRSSSTSGNCDRRRNLVAAPTYRINLQMCLHSLSLPRSSPFRVFKEG